MDSASSYDPSVGGHRSYILALFAGTLVAGYGIPIVSAWASGVPPQLSEAESEAVTRVGTEAAFAAFVAPPGAVPSVAAPVGGGVSLAFDSQQRIDQVELTGWWIVSGSPEQAMEYVKEHRPAGSEFGGSLASGRPLILNAISFAWPAVPRARSELRLEVSEAPLTSETTGLRVIATGTWLKPRAASEAVPAGTRLLRVDVTSSRRPGRAPQRLTITNRNRIERVATLLNALPIVQPIGSEIPCPLLPSGIVIGLAFYLHPHGRGGCGP